MWAAVAVLTLAAAVFAPDVAWSRTGAAGRTPAPQAPIAQATTLGRL